MWSSRNTYHFHVEKRQPCILIEQQRQHHLPTPKPWEECRHLRRTSWGIQVSAAPERPLPLQQTCLTAVVSCSYNGSNNRDHAGAPWTKINAHGKRAEEKRDQNRRVGWATYSMIVMFLSQICPYCQYEISSATQSTPGLIAYISGAVIALLGCFWGCCLIPCCFDECMDVRHTCPNCRSYLGQYRR